MSRLPLVSTRTVYPLSYKSGAEARRVGLKKRFAAGNFNELTSQREGAGGARLTDIKTPGARE